MKKAFSIFLMFGFFFTITSCTNATSSSTSEIASISEEITPPEIPPEVDSLLIEEFVDGYENVRLHYYGMFNGYCIWTCNGISMSVGICEICDFTFYFPTGMTFAVQNIQNIEDKISIEEAYERNIVSSDDIKYMFELHSKYFYPYFYQKEE